MTATWTYGRSYSTSAESKNSDSNRSKIIATGISRLCATEPKPSAETGREDTHGTPRSEQEEESPTQQKRSTSRRQQFQRPPRQMRSKPESTPNSHPNEVYDTTTRYQGPACHISALPTVTDRKGTAEEGGGDHDMSSGKGVKTPTGAIAITTVIEWPATENTGDAITTGMRTAARLLVRTAAEVTPDPSPTGPPPHQTPRYEHTTATASSNGP